MARERHDQLAKGIFTDWLELFCQVEPSKPVSSEERALDIVVRAQRPIPPWRETFGLLGRVVHEWAAFEVFRNSVSEWELRACVAKATAFEGELRRHARRRRNPQSTVSSPALLVITPTLSKAKQRDFDLKPMPSWPHGFLAPGDGWKMAVVVVHELPIGMETLFLRLMGRDEVQDRAYDELVDLPHDHPARSATVERMVHFRRATMRLPPLEKQEESRMTPSKALKIFERYTKNSTKADSIVVVLEARGVKVPPTLRKKLSTLVKESAELNRLLRRAATVTSAKDLFA